EPETARRLPGSRGGGRNGGRGAGGGVHADPATARLHRRRPRGVAAARSGLRRRRGGARSRAADGRRRAGRRDRSDAGALGSMNMDTLLVVTRKGLFTLRGNEVARVSFLGTAVAAVLQRNEAIYAAVRHGQFGAKLYRCMDDGASFQDAAGPMYLY